MTYGEDYYRHEIISILKVIDLWLIFIAKALVVRWDMWNAIAGDPRVQSYTRHGLTRSRRKQAGATDPYNRGHKYWQGSVG